MASIRLIVAKEIFLKSRQQSSAIEGMSVAGFVVVVFVVRGCFVLSAPFRPVLLAATKKKWMVGQTVGYKIV